MFLASTIGVEYIMKEFTASQLLEEIKNVGIKLDSRIEVYLIGGCSMSLRGLKSSTKDVDLVFTSKKELNDFSRVLEALNYSKYFERNPEYDQLDAVVIYRKENAAGFDLFLNKVCRALSLSEGMKERAVKFGEFGLLTVFLCSEEDIFIFKSITQRPRDVDDMATLVKSKLEKFDWNAMKKEMKGQSEEYPMLPSLALNKLTELKQKHEINNPLTSFLSRKDNKITLEQAFKIRLGKGMSKQEALEDLKKMGFTDKELKFLSKKGR